MDALFVFLIFGCFMLLLFSGFPVAFVLGGVGVLFAALGSLLAPFEIAEVAELRMIGFVSNRIFDTLSSYSLIPMSMFIFMGFMLDRSGIAERLILAMRRVLGPAPGGLAIAVVLIGVVLAASTGIIGASVVLLATIALPTMMQSGYARWISAGTVGATGCLGILVPPSIMLVVMGDQLRIPVGDLFMGAILPGLLLAASFVAFLLAYAWLRPHDMPAMVRSEREADTRGLVREMAGALLAPLLLVMAVLGSILAGIASPTEASGIGAAGATVLAWTARRLSWNDLRQVCYQTGRTVAFLYALIFGASCFSVVLRGYGGDEVIENALYALPFSPEGVLALVILVVFLLGFFLDWMEIVLIVAPLVMPVLTGFGFEPVWVAILMALCLQTSFLTPPVGMALFYLRSATQEISMLEIYKGAMPFVALQILTLLLVALFPALALWMLE
ncbi:TRAP transporter large permease [Marinobacterium marinum]|uniref:TRAP transporter large permease protein n=1 Tax=Marinobacterium marinum TaxID=2756129 RepID=A0A7W1WWJ7_9GAMM|nr:TRAP transporter large permease subunit [Marinobacterium marinum]MBA4501351.1 TRAP transporter large permease subunit [Marinobacterium marinum]